MECQETDGQSSSTGGSVGKESALQFRRRGNTGLTLGSGRSWREGLATHYRILV